jgi:hypothetical protein
VTYSTPLTENILILVFAIYEQQALISADGNIAVTPA